MSSDRQGKGRKIFESFILCRPVHTAALGFPPKHTPLLPAQHYHRFHQQQGRHLQRQPRGKRRNGENLSKMTLASEAFCSLRQHLQNELIWIKII